MSWQGVGLAQELIRPAAPTPVEAPSATNKVLGIPEKEFVKAQAALTETQSAAEVAKLDAQIDQLVAERHLLMLAIALKNHPEISDNIQVVADAITSAKANSGAKK